MSECKYRHKNGMCLKDLEYTYKGFCVDGPCTEFAPQTNADRIRSMTDEELAEFLIQDGDCPQGRRYPYSCPNCDRLTLKVCCDCWLDWLQKEVKK